MRVGDRLLEGKTGLVIGASQGIGMACARALAQDGATVVVMGRSEQGLVRTRAELAVQSPSARIEMFVGDGLQEDQVKAALTFTRGIGGQLDAVVATVGGPTFKPLLMRDLDGVRQEIDRNFIGAFLAVRHAAPLMQRGGTIVCISSAAVTQASWGLSIYAAAKAALERFVRAAAFELGGAGIRVNAVRPGATFSPERAATPAVSAMAEAFAAETPLGRIGQPDDIGRVVRFLVGPESAWVTGQTFSVDGGMDQGKGPDFMDASYGKEIMAQIRAGKPVD